MSNVSNLSDLDRENMRIVERNDIHDIAKALDKVTWKDMDCSFTACCPAHDDVTPSLSVTLGTNGKLLYHCHAGCSQEAVRRALNLLPSGLSRINSIDTYRREWKYQTITGRQVTVIREDYNNGTKKVWRDPPGVRGPYLPLIDSPNPNSELVVVEGEKCFEAIRELDMGVVTWIGGTSGVSRTDWSRLANHNVVIWQDNDSKGKQAGIDIAAILEGHKCKIRLVKIPDDTPLGWDAADADVNTRRQLIEEALEWYSPDTSTDDITPETGITSIKMDPPSYAMVAETIKRIGWKLRYNTRAMQIEVTEPDQPGREWIALNDNREHRLRSLIEKNFHYYTAKGDFRGMRFSREMWLIGAGTEAAKAEVDPFVEYLDQLPPWDGMQRIDDLLTKLFIVSPTMDDELVQWASRTIPLGAVWRAYNPGTKLDEMVVLVGAQGIGKSTFAAYLLPDNYRDDWFSDGLHLASHPKERAEALLGRVIVEVSEMAGASRADLESLKAFLSRQNDGSVRLAYRRNPESMPRRCVLVGTANNDPLPNDTTGNRRFLAVGLNGGTPTAVRHYLEQHREQIWAETLIRYQQGEEAWLPPHLIEKQSATNEHYRQSDTYLEEALDNLLHEILDEVATISEIKDKLPEHVRNVSPRRLSNALRARKWIPQQRMVSGKRKRIWIPPVKVNADDQV